MHARIRPRALFTAALLLAAAPALAVMPLETTPGYQSTPQGHVATGGGWADVDGDGWLDMVTANGNDIYRQRVAIYHNNGDGTLPLTPTWTSDDIDYHGHLDLGDIDGDGLVDLAVGVYLGPGGFGDPGEVKVYLNDGLGAFSATPDWTSGVDLYCFSVALGDADGDGDLDLACAAGESYYSYPDRYKLFYNLGGMLESLPSWESDEITYALDVTWDDVDLDGDLDLAFAGEAGPSRVYLNEQTAGGGIPTSASWESADLPGYANTCALGDWNGDDYPEFAVADNNQLGGAGRFKVYANSAGELGTSPAWTSTSGGYGSHVSWADPDLDGDRDLAAGRWWGYARIFENTGGGLTATPVWTSSTNSVIENMFWGDVDNDGLRGDGHSSATGDGLRTFVKLGHAPVRSVEQVLVDGAPLDPADYVVHHTGGWISLGSAPALLASIDVSYTYSYDLDLGVTNWDSSLGNYVFTNTTSLSGLPGFADAGFLLDAHPNPAAQRTVFRYQGEDAASASLAVYDVRGRRVRSLHQGPLAGGSHTWEWDARDAGGRRVAGGVYFAHFESSRGARTVKLVLM